MHVNDIDDFGGWEGYRVVDFENDGKMVTINLQSWRNHSAICPKYGCYTGYAHDYRWRKVRVLPSFCLAVWLMMECRRLRCPRCGLFTEELPWLGARYWLTRRFGATDALEI